MIRYFFILSSVLLLTTPVSAQIPPAWKKLEQRIRLPHEEETRDFFDDTDPNRIARKAAGHVGTLAAGDPLAVLGADLLTRVTDDQFEAAYAEYRRLLQDEEPLLVKPPPAEAERSDAMTSRDLRDLTQERLGRLPPSLVERYRRTVDAEALTLLQEGEASRSPAPLRRLVRDYFASGPTERALALLGDWAFEAGRFDEALGWWRLLAPLPDDAFGWSYPHGTFNRNRVHAKQILALIFAGRGGDAERELNDFRIRAANARGSFAGRDDRYVATLEHWLEVRRAEPTIDQNDTWPTFAGHPSRNLILPTVPSDRLWIDGPSWRAALPPPIKEPTQVRLSAVRALTVPATPYHPILVAGQVLVTDGLAITSHDLSSGEHRFRFAAEVGEPSGRPNGPYMLSASSESVFARLGSSGRTQELFALHLTGPAAGTVRWKARASVEDKVASFDSDPLVVGDRLYIAVLRNEEGWAYSYLDCYDVSNGALLWQVHLADQRNFGRDSAPARTPLLIATDSAIVVLSHSGFVAACDLTTGQRRWAVRYPGPEGAPSPRDASAGLYSDGRVFVAPADSANVYALDARTGRILWELPWVRPPSDIVDTGPAVSEIVQLYGVVEGRLVFADRYRLQVVDVVHGITQWHQPSIGKLPSHGRGLIAGPWVLWPTADPQLPWRIVTHQQGALSRLSADGSVEAYDPTTLRNLPAGNVVFADGCLVIATPKELVAFVSPKKRLPHLEREARTPPIAPATLYHLVLAQLDAGKKREADATIDELRSRVPLAAKPAWEALLRERRSPPKRVVVASLATNAPKSNLPSRVETINFSGALERAWGPLRGFAPPLRHDPNSTDGDLVAIVRDGELIGVDATSGHERWRREGIDPLMQSLWTAGDIIAVAGPRGVDAFSLADGTFRWRQSSESGQRGRWLLIDGQPESVRSDGRFDRFRLQNSHLICIGDRRAVFVRMPTGDCDIDYRPTHVKALLDDGVKPADLFPRPVIFDCWNTSSPSTGRDAVRWNRFERHWVEPGAGATLLGLDGGEVRYQADIGSSWSYEPPWPTSLTGEAPQVMGHDDLLFALIPRNHGTELLRLDRRTGRALWSVPPHELHDGFDVRAAAWDERAIYYPYRGQIIARAVADGAVLWKQHRPSQPGPWQIDRFGGTLVIWPRTASGIPILPVPDTALLAPVALAWGRRGIGSLPILLLDAKTGQPRQQIDVPHDGGPVFVWAQDRYLYVTAGALVTAYRSIR